MTFAKLERETQSHSGELALTDQREVVRFLGVQEDEEDMWYRLFSMEKGCYLYSAVMGVIWLKGKINQQDYERMEQLWKYQFDAKFGVGR